MKKISIRRRAYEKIADRSPWLYRNDLPQNLYTQPGEVAWLVYDGHVVATAFINQASKIAARILAYEAVEIDRDFFEKRLRKAIGKRAGVPSNAYRIVHSEADGLPGLVADLYGPYLILSITTAGMDRYKENLVDLFIQLLDLQGIYERGDSIRSKEGLEIRDRTLWGDVADEFVIEEGRVRFVSRLKEAQKTGFFLDQRKNRRIVGSHGRRHTLDLFANAGGFGIYARSERTTFVEISKSACAAIEVNARLNGLRDYEIVRKDVFKFLETDERIYDLIVVDPPAFAKSKKSRSGAMRGWKYLIARTVDRLEEGGYLALFSCSHALGMKDLETLVRSVCIEKDVVMEVVEWMKQDIDHPWILTIPNSLYLTGLLLRKG